MRFRRLFPCLLAVSGLFCTQAHSARVILLDEKALEGEIVALTEDAVVLKRDNKEERIGAEQILRIVLLPNAPEPAPGGSAFSAVLTDGSQLHPQAIAFQAGEVSLDIPGIPAFRAPVTALMALFVGGNPENDPELQKELKSVQRTSDVLFLRKASEVHRLEGAAQSFDGNILRFLWEGENLPVPKDKIAGLFFYRPQSREMPRPVCTLSDVAGNQFEAARFGLEKGQFTFQTPAGLSAALPFDKVKALDFSRAKVTFLSSLDPVSVREDPYFDVVWHFRKDQNLKGGPISLRGRKFERGISMHSRCRLTYSVAGQYRRFRAVVGIDDTAGNWGHVVCRVLGDNAVLFESELKGGDEPREIDLDVANVKLLALFVDFGEKLDIGDRVAFADARLIK